MAWALAEKHLSMLFFILYSLLILVIESSVIFCIYVQISEKVKKGLDKAAKMCGRSRY